MGLRDRIKSKVKTALGMNETHGRPTAPDATETSASPQAPDEKQGAGEDTAWYLKYDDLDGWDNTNANDGVDED
jgi:hypothetical protein